MSRLSGRLMMLKVPNAPASSDDGVGVIVSEEVLWI